MVFPPNIIARIVLAIAGAVFSPLVFLWPAPKFFQIWRTGSTKGISESSYLAALMTCLVLTIYGLPKVQPHEMLGTIINGVGCIVNVIYIITLLVHSDHRRRRVRRALIIVAVELIFSGCMLLYVFLDRDEQRKTLVIGVIAMVISVGNSTLTFPILLKVIKTGSTEGSSFSTSLLASSNGLCEVAYGFLPFDPVRTVPTLIVTAISTTEVILYVIFHKSRKATELELKEVVVDPATSSSDYIRCKMMLGLFSPLHHHDVAAFISGSIISAPTLLSLDTNVVTAAIKEMAPRTNWVRVIECLDHEGMLIHSEEQFLFIITLYRKGCEEPFPLHAIYGSVWENTKGQLSFLTYAVSAPPEVFSFAHSARKLALDDYGIIRPEIHAGEDSVLPWQCLDLLEVLCQLAERGHASSVRLILRYPLTRCLEVLLLGMAHINPADSHFHHEVLKSYSHLVTSKQLSEELERLACIQCGVGTSGSRYEGGVSQQLDDMTESDSASHVRYLSASQLSLESVSSGDLESVSSA